jgi:hypothetical protein
MRRLLRLILWLALLLVVVWGAAALWLDGPASRPVAGVLSGAYALTALALLIWVRPGPRAVLAFGLLFAAVLAWWLNLAPSNDRNWQPDVARLPTAEIQGNVVTIRNVRDFRYRSEVDYTELWETRTYDLSKLRAMDLFVIYWGSPAIAHTILSWDFEDGQRLAISIETRKEVGESYSAARGFFRQYELYYVVADERDVIALRTNYRREDVYLYPLRTPPARARAILEDYLQTINHLARQPRWYNAFTQNCTTTIRLHAARAVGGIPHDWRWLANGYLDELLYKDGIINRDLPFAQFKSLSHINPKAQAVPLDGNFSEVIRKGLPPRPPPPY